MANFLQRRDKFMTVHNKFSKIQTSATMHTWTGVPESCAVRGTFEGLLCNVTKEQTSLVVWWSELLTTNHKVPGSIPGSTMGIFPCMGEDPRGDHGLGS